MNNVVKLTKSAKDSDLGLLREELKKGADINCEGSFLLLNSVIFGNSFINEEYIQFLIKNGIDINQKTSYGRTALHYAAMLGDLRIVQILLENGIDVNAIDLDHCNALMKTCEHNFLLAPWNLARDEDSLNFSKSEKLKLQDNYNSMYWKIKERKQMYDNQIRIIKLLLESGINKMYSASNPLARDFATREPIEGSALDLAISNSYDNDMRVVRTLCEYNVPLLKEHHNNFNFGDELFNGGLDAFICDGLEYRKTAKKLQLVNKYNSKK
jgi:ankyrin repeat protein